MHHLNGVKDDNRPENLVALPGKLHLRVLAEQRRRIRELEARLREAINELDGLRKSLGGLV